MKNALISLEQCTLNCIWLSPLSHTIYGGRRVKERQCTILATPNDSTISPFLLHGRWNTHDDNTPSTKFYLSETEYKSQRSDIDTKNNNSNTHIDPPLNAFTMIYDTRGNCMIRLEDLPNNIPDTPEMATAQILTYVTKQSAALHTNKNPMDNIATWIRHQINLQYPEYANTELWLRNNKLYNTSPLINEDDALLTVVGLSYPPNTMLPEPTQSYNKNWETWEYEYEDGNEKYQPYYDLIPADQIILFISTNIDVSHHTRIETLRELHKTLRELHKTLPDIHIKPNNTTLYNSDYDDNEEEED